MGEEGDKVFTAGERMRADNAKLAAADSERREVGVPIGLAITREVVGLLKLFISKWLDWKPLAVVIFGAGSLHILDGMINGTPTALPLIGQVASKLLGNALFCTFGYVLAFLVMCVAYATIRASFKRAETEGRDKARLRRLLDPKRASSTDPKELDGYFGIDTSEEEASQ